MFGLHNLYKKITDLNNLFYAFREFRRGKRKKREVAEFELNLEENIFALKKELDSFSYEHGGYFSFKIFDPKARIIHKAEVRDRIVHQALFRVLYPIFDRSFIFDSYSSRLKKGTHQAVKRLNGFVRKESANYKKPCFAVKLDVEKFFYHIDHKILLELIKEKITCPETLWLTKKIIDSYSSDSDKGLPLGNVTSQLFANIYLDSLDKFVKQELKEKYYLRFCDDLIFLREDAGFDGRVSKIKRFIKTKLLLRVKIDKLKVRKLKWGFDFLGYVILPYHLVLRTKTKKRMFLKIREKKKMLDMGLLSFQEFNQFLNSYLGLLRHCYSSKLKTKLNKIL